MRSNNNNNTHTQTGWTATAYHTVNTTHSKRCIRGQTEPRANEMCQFVCVCARAHQNTPSAQHFPNIRQLFPRVFVFPFYCHSARSPRRGEDEGLCVRPQSKMSNTILWNVIHTAAVWGGVVCVCVCGAREGKFRKSNKF